MYPTEREGLSGLENNMYFMYCIRHIPSWEIPKPNTDHYVNNKVKDITEKQIE